MPLCRCVDLEVNTPVKRPRLRDTAGAVSRVDELETSLGAGTARLGGRASPGAHGA